MNSAALPRFTTVICNYNYADFVADAIRSALAQDYPPELIEVVVVDDGSTDGSRTVYQAFAHDDRVKLILQENRGQTAAFDAGVLAATGDYICLLDSDDVFLPGKLRRLARHIESLELKQEPLFLCHDLAIEDLSGPLPQTLGRSWFGQVGIDRLPDHHTPAGPIHHFPFSVPCGLVFSRDLITRCLQAMPTWAFPRGTDGVLCPAAFIAAKGVHYLRETLASYRVHGGNEFASLQNGQFRPKFNPKGRAPRTLFFLERWIDELDLSPDHRHASLNHVRGLERLVRQPSLSRAVKEPTVDIVRLDRAHEATAPVETAHTHSTVLTRSVPVEQGQDLQAMAHAYRESSGDFVVFVHARDVLDRDCVERLLVAHLHGALVGAVCCDIRLIGPGSQLLHSDMFRHSGAWKQDVQHIPPLATRLHDWVAPPLSACMFRRSAFLDLLFAQAHSLDPALQTAGGWLCTQLALHTGGIMRLRETMVSCHLVDGAGANYGFFSGPQDGNGQLMHQPPVPQALAWLAAQRNQAQPVFQRWLPPAWHQRMDSWLAAH